MAAVCTICLLEIWPRVFIKLSFSLFPTSETKRWQNIVMWRQWHVTLPPTSHNLSHEKHMNQLSVNIKTTSDGKFNCCLLKSYWLCVSNVTFSNNWVMKYITSGDWNVSRRQMLFHKLKTKLFDYIQSHSLNTLNEEKLVSKVSMTYIFFELPDCGSLLCKSHLQAHRVPHQRDNKYVKLNLWNWLKVRYMLAFFFRTVQ